MSINAIIGLLITAAVLGAVLLILDMYVYPHVEGFVPAEAKKYARILFAILLVFLAGFLGKGVLPRYVRDAALVIAAVAFEVMFQGFMSKEGA